MKDLLCGDDIVEANLRGVSRVEMLSCRVRKAREVTYN
jgi:hypothetical protein